MYEISQEGAAFICLGLAMLTIACFALGYQAGDHKNAYVIRHTRSQLRMVERQKREIGEWVRKNWPNEMAAFENGHDQGYQQGLDHGALMDEADVT